MFLETWCNNFARNVGGNVPGKAMERPKYWPRAPKMSPGGPKMRPRGANSGPSASKVDFLPIFFHSGGFWSSFGPQLGQLETAKRRPKRPQRRPRERQVLPKRGPRGSQKGPKCGPRGSQAKHRKNLGFFMQPPSRGGTQGDPENLEKSLKIDPGRPKNR